MNLREVDGGCGGGERNWRQGVQTTLMRGVVGKEVGWREGHVDNKLIESKTLVM